MRLLRNGILPILLFSLLSACGPAATAQPYQPPTAVNPYLPETQAAPGGIAATLPPPACSNNLTYIEDVNIPDGMFVAPGMLLDKQWRVQNSGTCNWDSAYRVKLVSGDALGAKTEQALFPARAGSEFILHINFTVPSQGGLIRSQWQAVTPGGQPFGDPVFIEVNVTLP